MRSRNPRFSGYNPAVESQENRARRDRRSSLHEIAGKSRAGRSPS
jgi:hypothetical protein